MGQTVEEGRYMHLNITAHNIETAGANTVGAIFVLLNLLKCCSDVVAGALLGNSVSRQNTEYIYKERITRRV